MRHSVNGERAARFWPEAERRKLVDSVLKLLDEKDLQPILGEQARPESRSWGH